MKVNNKIETVHKKLIVSCQALPEEPLHSSFIMGRMALAAKEGGAAGIRANTKEDIAEIRKNVDLPIIGIVKRDYPDCKVYITPTMKEIDELMEVKPEIIAIDATKDLRPNGVALDEFYAQIREKYPNQLLMADCSTYEEAKHAVEHGADIVAPTLYGYTKETANIEGADYRMFAKICRDFKEDAYIMMEGHLYTPEDAMKCIYLGAHAVVVGSAITRPHLTAKRFVDLLSGYQHNWRDAEKAKH